MNNKRIVSGMRPTGKLHLGHYPRRPCQLAGTAEEFECFFFAADWHSLTTEYANTDGIGENTHEMVLDWLAFGIDPEKSTIFLQSRVPQHAELNLILSMITPVSWLERNPTYKEMQENLSAKDLSTFGFLGYPVLMASDIIVYKATRVPVGQDQLPHLEITREIARRFNYLYGEVFPEPAALLTETPKVLGLDGRKMSKSYGNAIFLSETAEETTEEGDVDGDRRAAAAPYRSGRAGPLRGLYPALPLYLRGEEGRDRRGLPRCPDRLRGLQEDPGRGAGGNPGAVPGKA